MCVSTQVISISLYALNELLAGSTIVIARLPLSSVLGLVTSLLQANDRVGVLWTKFKVWLQFGDQHAKSCWDGQGVDNFQTLWHAMVHMCWRNSHCGPTCVATMLWDCASDFMTCTNCAVCILRANDLDMSVPVYIV